jgi:hypothetical protein
VTTPSHRRSIPGDRFKRDKCSKRRRPRAEVPGIAASTKWKTGHAAFALEWDGLCPHRSRDHAEKGDWLDNGLWLSVHQIATSCGACPFFQQFLIGAVRQHWQESCGSSGSRPRPRQTKGRGIPASRSAGRRLTAEHGDGVAVKARSLLPNIQFRELHAVVEGLGVRTQR